jgi:RNA polymerase sigma factor (sigma-70 family)
VGSSKIIGGLWARFENRTRCHGRLNRLLIRMMRTGERMANPSKFFVRLAWGRKLGELYDLHAPEGYRLAFRLTGDREAAADIVQDAFVKLFGRFADLREPEAFASYLRRTVVNLATDRFRRLRAERLRDSRQQAVARSESADLPDIETRQVIGQLLRRLPRRQQAALILRFYEDLSEQQTAEILGCSVAAVRNLVLRGMDGLRRSLGEERWT